MSKRRAGIATIFAAAILALPYIAAAAPLVPCFGTACQACHIVLLLNRVISFAIGLSIPIAIGLFAYAGWLYFTSSSNEGNIKQAKSIFSTALIGLLIALSAYLVVETVLHAVLSQDYWSGWNQIQCLADNEQTRPMQKDISALFGQAIAAQGGGVTANGAPGTPGAAGTADVSSLSRNVKLAPGITVVGAQQGTLDNLNQLAAECGCTILVTSLTGGVHETGTYSHANGYKADISMDGGVTTYIENNFTPSGTRSDGAALWTSPSGAVYANEATLGTGPHWDILVK